MLKDRFKLYKFAVKVTLVKCIYKLGKLNRFWEIGKHFLFLLVRLVKETPPPRGINLGSESFDSRILFNHFF